MSIKKWIEKKKKQNEENRRRIIADIHREHVKEDNEHTKRHDEYLEKFRRGK